MAYYIDSYPVTKRRRVERRPAYYQQRDLVEPEEDSYAPHPVLDGFACPVCNKGFMSNDEVTYARLCWNKPVYYFHHRCLTDDSESLLEKLDYDLNTDTGAWMEAHL